MNNFIIYVKMLLDRSLTVIPLLLLFTLVSSEIIITSSVENLPSGFNATEFLTGLGYPLEYHQRIPTEDGYLLNIIRIPHGKNNSNSSGPKPASIKQMLHYLQIFLTSTFNMYDYGAEKNFEVYAQKSAPDYKLENVTAPVAVYYGIMDFFSTPN